MEIDAALKEMSRLLYGGNYEVFLRRYEVTYRPENSLEQYVADALGLAAKVGGSCAVAPQEVPAEIEESLCHAGDEAYGPDISVLKSRSFAELRERIVSHVQKQLASASLIQMFWLKEGHPAYPVYWDFAFVIAVHGSAEILIGSSSD